MIKSEIVIAILLFYFSPGSGSQGCLKTSACPDYTVPVNDRCYQYPGFSRSWNDASKYCQEQGGFLAIPDLSYNFTTRDLANVYPHIVDLYLIWIGASSKGSFIQYKWVNGSVLPLDHSNWQSGHPPGADDLCVEIYRMSETPYRLRTSNCNTRRYFLCQFNPAS